MHELWSQLGRVRRAVGMEWFHRDGGEGCERREPWLGPRQTDRGWVMSDGCLKRGKNACKLKGSSWLLFLGPAGTDSLASQGRGKRI